jgi:precorrin-2/cobalt-factor-2 C20-methyltransferase
MSGQFFCIGVGPGDPELLTLKAVRLLGECTTVAHFAKRGHDGHASRIAGTHIPAGAERLRFEYPHTTEILADDPTYISAFATFYAHTARQIGLRLEAGGTVGLLCEGDPFFYGSAMHVFERLRAYPSVVVPGVTGMAGAWAAALLPMTQGNDVLAVLPGTLSEAALVARLGGADAAVIMKTGRNLPKIRRALQHVGRLADAIYVEYATMAASRVLNLRDVETPAPYFSLILVPGWRQRP